MREIARGTGINAEKSLWNLLLVSNGKQSFVLGRGKFADEAPDYCRGRWVKDCDRDIIRDLKQRGLLFHQEQYVHEYPFCWRAEQDPLAYRRERLGLQQTCLVHAQQDLLGGDQPLLNCGGAHPVQLAFR